MAIAPIASASGPTTAIERTASDAARRARYPSTRGSSPVRRTSAPGFRAPRAGDAYSVAIRRRSWDSPSTESASARVGSTR